MRPKAVHRPPPSTVASCRKPCVFWRAGRCRATRSMPRNERRPGVAPPSLQGAPVNGRKQAPRPDLRRCRPARPALWMGASGRRHSPTLHLRPVSRSGEALHRLRPRQHLLPRRLRCDPQTGDRSALKCGLSANSPRSRQSRRPTGALHGPSRAKDDSPGFRPGGAVRTVATAADASARDERGGGAGGERCVNGTPRSV